MVEPRAKFDALGVGEQRGPFNRITAAELESAQFDMTHLVEGVLAKDQPAGLVGRLAVVELATSDHGKHSWVLEKTGSGFHCSQYQSRNRPRIEGRGASASGLL